MAVTTSTSVDPLIQPSLQYGLTEAQRLYQSGGPQYYQGQSYVGPSQTTNTGLQALEARAKQGSPLVNQAQQAFGKTINGDYLSGNPFFQGAFAPAAQAATSQFNQSIGDVTSSASKAGRYGSNAMGTMLGNASNQLAQNLTNTAGTLAYQNYADERGRQMSAAAGAPQMAQSDYQDIQNLLSAGQAREGYQGQQLQADMNKFNFLQNQPQQNLQNYMSLVYGNPLGKVGSSTQSGSADTSTMQNVLGTAATLGGLYKNTNGFSGLTNWFSGGSGGGFTADPTASTFGSNWWD
jgi:hypothetical protein